MNDALPALLHGFFHHWLAEQRNASRHTDPRLSGCMALIPALRGEPDRTPGCKAHAHRSDCRRSHSVPSARRNRARGVDRHSQLPSGGGEKLLSLCRRSRAMAPLHSVPRCFASLRRKKPNELSVTSNRKRWRPFWRSPIERLYWGNATTHCWASSITPERAFRRHWTFAQTISTLSHRLTSGFSGRAARNGSARCGPKPQTCYWPSCTGDPEVRTSRSSAIGTGGSSAHPAFAFNCVIRQLRPQKDPRTYPQRRSRRTPSATRPLSISSPPAST